MLTRIPPSVLSTLIVPPFTLETATQKVRLAENAWNSRDPDRVALAYSEDSEWRNRSDFVVGRDQIREFLSAKWNREIDYRLAWTRTYLKAYGAIENPKRGVWTIRADFNKDTIDPQVVIREVQAKTGAKPIDIETIIAEWLATADV